MPAISRQVGEGIEIGRTIITVTSCARGQVCLHVRPDPSLPLARIEKNGSRRYIRSVLDPLNRAIAIKKVTG